MKLVIKSKKGYLGYIGYVSFWTKDKNNPNIMFMDSEHVAEEMRRKHGGMIMPVEMHDRFKDMADDEW